MEESPPWFVRKNYGKTRKWTICKNKL